MKKFSTELTPLSATNKFVNCGTVEKNMYRQFIVMSEDFCDHAFQHTSLWTLSFAFHISYLLRKELMKNH